MSERARRFWPLAAAAVIAVVTVAGPVAVWRSRNRADLEGFAGFAISAAGIAAGWIAWVWRHKSSQGSEVVSGQELGRLADLLAGAVEAEWTRAAGEQRLRAGLVSELHEVYGGLGSGRLMIAGGPGSGKSGAAVLLILAALRHRRSVPEQARPQVPVPVMFTLHGWDPGTQKTRDWLAGRLCRTYPLFGGKPGAGAARRMLDEGRIAVILDGLDEIPEDLRPAVLRALSQQATFRLVLLTRSAGQRRGPRSAAGSGGHRAAGHRPRRRLRLPDPDPA